MQIGGRGFKVKCLWRTSPKNSNKSFQGLDYSASDTYHVGKSVSLVLSGVYRIIFYSDPKNVTESHMVESLKASVLHVIWASDQFLTPFSALTPHSKTF